MDINKDDFTIDVSRLKAKITKKSKAIIPVHLYGHPSDMDEIIELCNTHSLDLIEDACQSLGSVYKKKQTGTMGIMGCFSLYASKVLTCGEGGAIATDDDNLADNLKMIRNHGMVEGYDTRVFGLNFRLPELSAAVAKAQMNKLPKMLDLRRQNAELLTEMLFPIVDKSKIKVPQETQEKKFNWYLYTIAFEENNIRDKIKEKMINDKIGVAIYYKPPVHKTPYYDRLVSSDKNNNNLGKTEWASEHVLSLPVHPSVTNQDIERMVESIKKHNSIS